MKAKVALAFASMLLVLATAEAVLRFDDRRPPVDFMPVELRGNPYLLNESPQRWARLPTSMIVLGDSFTEGRNCGSESNYPAILGELAVSRGLPDTVNLGIAGRNPFEYLALSRDVMAVAGPPRFFFIYI